MLSIFLPFFTFYAVRPSSMRSRAPRAPLAGTLLQGRGGGGVAHPLTSGPPVPSNLQECYLYIFMYECMYKYPAPPPLSHGHFDRHVGHSPPILRNFLQHCFYFIRGILCRLICYTADCVSAGMMTIGRGVW